MKTREKRPRPQLWPGRPRRRFARRFFPPSFAWDVTALKKGHFDWSTDAHSRNPAADSRRTQEKNRSGWRQMGFSSRQTLPFHSARARSTRGQAIGRPSAPVIARRKRKRAGQKSVPRGHHRRTVVNGSRTNAPKSTPAPRLCFLSRIQRVSVRVKPMKANPANRDKVGPRVRQSRSSMQS